MCDFLPNFMNGLLWTGPQSRTKKKSKATCHSKHNLPIALYRLNHGLSIEALIRAGARDINCVYADEDCWYLAVLKVLSNRVIGNWSVSSMMTYLLFIDTPQMAIGRQNPDTGLLRHSDRGCRYVFTDYKNILKGDGITSNMRRKNNCSNNTCHRKILRTFERQVNPASSVSYLVRNDPKLFLLYRNL